MARLKQGGGGDQPGPLQPSRPSVEAAAQAAVRRIEKGRAATLGMSGGMGGRLEKPGSYPGLQEDDHP